MASTITRDPHSRANLSERQHRKKKYRKPELRCLDCIPLRKQSSYSGSWVFTHTRGPSGRALNGFPPLDVQGDSKEPASNEGDLQ